MTHSKMKSVGRLKVGRRVRDRMLIWLSEDKSRLEATNFQISQGICVNPHLVKYHIKFLRDSGIITTTTVVKWFGFRFKNYRHIEFTEAGQSAISESKDRQQRSLGAGASVEGIDFEDDEDML